MHLNKQHIVRNTLIVLTSFVGGIITTVLAGILNTTLTPDQYAANMLIELSSSITERSSADKLAIYQAKLADIPFYIETLNVFRTKLETTIQDIHVITGSTDIDPTRDLAYTDYINTNRDSTVTSPTGRVVTTVNDNTNTTRNTQSTDNDTTHGITNEELNTQGGSAPTGTTTISIPRTVTTPETCSATITRWNCESIKTNSVYNALLVVGNGNRMPMKSISACGDDEGGFYDMNGGHYRLMYDSMKACTLAKTTTITDTLVNCKAGPVNFHTIIGNTEKTCIGSISTGTQGEIRTVSATQGIGNTKVTCTSNGWTITNDASMSCTTGISTTGTTESNSNMSQQNQTTTNPTGTVNNTNQTGVVSTFPVTTDPRELKFTVTPNKTKIIAGDTVEIAYNIGAAFTTCTAQFQVGNSWTTQNTGEFFTSGRDERQGVFVVNRPYSKMIVDCIGAGGITKRSQEMPLELVNIPTNLNSNEMKNFLNGFNFTTAKNTKPYCISVNANTCPVILKSKGLPYRINSSVNSVNGAFDLVQCVYKDVGGTWNVDGLGGARGINSGYIAGFSVADAEFCYNDANFKSAPFYDHGDTPAITRPLPPSDPSSQVSVVAAPIPTVKGKSSGSQDFITLGSTDTELRTRDGETATMQFGNDGGAATCTLNGGTVPNSIAYSDNYTYSCTNATATKSVNFHVTVLAPRVVDYEAVTPYVTDVLSRLGQTDMAYQEIANRYKVISLGMTDQQKYEIIKRITYALGGGEAQIAGVKVYIDSH